MPLTTDEKLELLRVINHGRLQADSYVDTVGDAVLVAVNQVQEKRLDLTIVAQTVDSTDRVLQLLLGIALQSAGGWVMKTVTSQVLQRLSQSRLLVGRISPDITGGLKTTSQVHDLGIFRRGDVDIKSAFDYIDAERLDRPFIRAWSLGLLAVYKESVGTVKIPTGSLKRPNPLADRLTPGASILNSALEWRTEQMALNTFTFEELQNFVLLDLVQDADHAEAILKNLRTFNLPLCFQSRNHPLTLGEIRDLYVEFFEFTIWALFIVSTVRGRAARAKAWGYVNTQPRLRVFENSAADVHLTHYLVRTRNRSSYDAARGNEEKLRRYVGGELPRLWDELVERYSAAKTLERDLGGIDTNGTFP
ncbi:MAG: hypothetical protein ACTH2Q_18635 [Propionibacteriaceae bacterium]